MIERKLIVGRYLELNIPMPVTPGPAALGFQEYNRVVLHIEESESSAAPVAPLNPRPGFNPTLPQKVAIAAERAGQHIKSQFDRQRTSTTGVGPAAKAHRNFVWLPWLPGFVSEVQPAGMDVLTGPMSGCWITSYLKGGIRYIGHVGTEDLHDTPNSIAARAAWNTFAAGLPVNACSGFNPFNDDWIGGPVPLGVRGESARKTFALVTAVGTLHTVITYPQLNKPTRIRIAGIQQNASSLPANGQIV
jgi:hypothetical protein